MRRPAILALLAAVAGCTAVGGEQFTHVAAPATLSPVPHDAADRARFETLHVPGATDAVQALWRDRFLTGALDRAFAVSPHHAGFSAGAPSADAAVERALAACRRSGEPCTTYAINTEIVAPGAAATLPFRGRALGPFTPSPEYVFYGPAVAKGLVVWSHGTGKPCEANGARFAAPAIVTLLNRDGWDVVRFDRDPCADDLAAALRRMPAGLDAATSAGYRRIVLAGQSRGALQSFELMRDPALRARVTAVLGFSPANTGDDVYAGTIGAARWVALATALSGSLTAEAFFFDSDPFNPLARQQVAATNDLWRTQLPNAHAVFDADPAIVRSGGHGAAASAAFTAKYGPCLLALVNGAPASGPCNP